GVDPIHPHGRLGVVHQADRRRQVRVVDPHAGEEHLVALLGKEGGDGFGGEGAGHGQLLSCEALSSAAHAPYAELLRASTAATWAGDRKTRNASTCRCPHPTDSCDVTAGYAFLEFRMFQS